jgi:hypothetical protein
MKISVEMAVPVDNALRYPWRRASTATNPATVDVISWTTLKQELFCVAVQYKPVAAFGCSHENRI